MPIQEILKIMKNSDFCEFVWFDSYVPVNIFFQLCRS